jgi:hypothetical protein
MHSPLQTINLHLETALNHISNRDNPDYRNSIKESISAIESLCVQIVGKKKDTLGKALNYIKDNSKTTISIPEKLNDAFKNLMVIPVKTMELDMAYLKNQIFHLLMHVLC